MNRRTHWAVGLMLACMMVSGCGRGPTDGPPAVRLGDDQCVQCGMIISDERFATATIVAGPRGPEPRLFDDFNCQVNFEVEHPELAVEARWAHDQGTLAWFNAATGSFIISPDIRSPMGSNTAAFATRAAAAAANEEIGGDLLSFETAWSRLGGPVGAD